MTDIIVNDIRPRVQYTQQTAGNKVFDIPFPVLDASDLKVAVGYVPQDSAAYTVHLQDTQNRYVELDVAPAVDTVVSLWRDMPFERTTDFTPGADLRAAVLNDELDRTALLLQQVEALVGDSIHQAPYDLHDDLVLPPAPDRAERLLAFDADGSVTVSSRTVSQVESGAATAESSAVDAIAAKMAAEAAQTVAVSAQNSASVSASAAAVSAASAADLAASVGNPLPRDGSLPMTGPLSGTGLAMASASGPAGYNGRNVLRSSTALSSWSLVQSAGNDSLLELRAPLGSPSAISFHIPGVSGIKFGLDSDGRFRAGAWSFPANAFNLDGGSGGRLALGTNTGGLGNYKLSLEGRPSITGGSAVGGVNVAVDTGQEALMFSDHAQATLRGGPRPGGRFSIWTDSQKLGIGDNPDSPAIDVDPAARRIRKRQDYLTTGGGYNRLTEFVRTNTVNYVDLSWGVNDWAQIRIPCALYAGANNLQFYIQLFVNGVLQQANYVWENQYQSVHATGGPSAQSYAAVNVVSVMQNGWWHTGEIVINQASTLYGNHRGFTWHLAAWRNDASYAMHYIRGAALLGHSGSVSGIRIGVTGSTMNFAGTAYGLLNA